jgi:hypothetical protein
MASKQEYLNMMKRMEMMQGKGALTDAEMKMLDRMGEEKIPAKENMGMDSLMRQDDIESIIKGDPNLSKMRIQPRSEEMIMREIQSGKGSMSNAELDAIKNSAMASGMGAMSDAEMKALENALGGSVSDEIREAVSALISMGIPLETALETLNETEGLASALGKPETNPMTMPEGALGSLPTRTGGSMSDTEANMFDADRTQSLDMQKEAMGT